MACRSLPIFFIFYSPPLIFCHGGSSTWLLGQGCFAKVCFPASILIQNTAYIYMCTCQGTLCRLSFYVVLCQGKILGGSWHFNVSVAFICAGTLQCYLYKLECLQPGKSGWETSTPTQFPEQGINSVFVGKSNPTGSSRGLQRSGGSSRAVTWVSSTTKMHHLSS